MILMKVAKYLHEFYFIYNNIITMETNLFAIKTHLLQPLFKMGHNRCSININWPPYFF
jgi:hypothetical protein